MPNTLYPKLRRCLSLAVMLIFVASLMVMSGHNEAQGQVEPHNCGEKDNPKKINFAGQVWNVKHGDGRGPGPNDFSHSRKSVWVDEFGRLHLKIRKTAEGKWLAAEICQTGITTYGMHRFEVIGNIDTLNPNVVLGLFVYELPAEGKVDEIDIEFSRWGNPDGPNGQFVVQPYDTPGNIHPFTFELAKRKSTHYFDWCPEGVQFKSIQGLRPEPVTPGQLIQSWVYTGADNPPANIPLRVHLNLWIFDKANFVPTPEEELNGIEVILRAVQIDTQPNRPVLVAPANAATLTETPEFSWSETDAANSYHLQVTTAADPTFIAPVIDELLPPVGDQISLNFTPETPLAAGDYLWRVSSYCGDKSKASKTRTFSINAAP